MLLWKKKIGEWYRRERVKKKVGEIVSREMKMNSVSSVLK